MLAQRKCPLPTGRPALARIPQADLPFPFRCQQIVVDPNLIRLYLIAVEPDIVLHVRERRIGEALGIVGPNVTAPPVFRLLHLGQNPIRFEGLARAHRDQAMLEIVEGADDDVKITNAGLMLIGDPADDFGCGTGNDFHLEPEFLSDRGFQCPAQLRARRNAEDHLAFLLCGLHSLDPFALPICLGRGGK